DGLESAQFGDGTIASTRVAVNTLNHIGLDKVVGDELAFINIDNDLILTDAILSVPKDRFVLELLETINVTDAMLERIKELKKLGFKFALDDVSCSEEFLNNFRPIFPYLYILKLDASIIDKESLESHLDEIKGFDYKLLAEKVETKEDYEYFRDLGCEYFQGYFFARPNLITKKALDPMYSEIFQLINLLDHESSIEEISEAFENSPDVTIQLLKFMNSATLSLSTNIRSIKHAIAILGRSPLKRWLLLIAFSKSESAVDGMRSPIVTLAQSRAKLMGELASKLVSHDMNKDEASLTGILSLIDVITDTPMQETIKELNISSNIRYALLDKEGSLGILLELAIAIESLDFDKAEEAISKLNISNEIVNKSIIESYNI
ncbi:MAG: EAL domain-containing protein, partial [Thiovulaceae bacterium]|nr:EAL domain-containing protein [Sulfurimonadaceae bacterium]